MNNFVLHNNYKNLIKEKKNNNKIIYLNWNRSSLSEDISLITYIEKNEIKLKKKYFELINTIKNFKILGKSMRNHFLISKNFSLWDMSLFEESSIYKNFEINSLLKILALKDLAKIKKTKKIYINNCDSDLKDNLLSLINNIKVYYKNLKIKKRINFRETFVYTFFFIFFFFIKRIGYKNNLERLKKKSILVCDYFSFINERKLTKGKYESSYWKNLLPILKKKKLNINFLHIDLDKKNYHLRYSIEKINKINDNENETHTIIDSLMDFNIFFTVLYFWIKNYTKYFLFFIFNSKNLIFKNKIINKIFKSSFLGVWSIKNIYIHFLFKKFFQNFEDKNNIIIYVNEFHGWERSFIYNSKKNTSHIYGIQFNPIRNWDLRFYRILSQKKSYLYPKYIINFYNSAKIKYKKLTKIHKNIKLLVANNLRPTVFKLNNKINKSKSVLLIGDHDDYSTNNMLNLVNEFCHKKNNLYKFEYKPHPVSNIQITKYKNLKKIKVYKTNSCLNYNYFAYIVCNKTSLAYELYEKKMKFAVILDSESINYSPVDQSNKSNFINNIEDLEKFLLEKHFYKKKNKMRVTKILWNDIVSHWYEKLKFKDA